jgi:hypothetical protein
MSAISFGGSFELVRSGDETWKKIMSKCLITAPVTLAALTPDYEALTNQGERNSFYIYRLYSSLQ